MKGTLRRRLSHGYYSLPQNIFQTDLPTSHRSHPNYYN